MTEAPQYGGEDGPVVGLTGARFGGGGRQRRRRALHRTVPSPHEVPTEPIAIVAEDVPPADSPPALTGARFRRTAPPAPDEPSPQDGAVDESLAAAPRDVPPLDPDDTIWGDDAHDARVLVRPYVLTGGRTSTAHELPLEALVRAVPGAAQPATVEHRQVVDLCADARSVAEIAAMVRVPLGVARVFVGDLADARAVTVHVAAVAELDLMRRVLAGLRRL